jgi:uncharacterized protein (DUF983 family)
LNVTAFEMLRAVNDMAPQQNGLDQCERSELLPKTGFEAAQRGARGLCPSCARQPLFPQFLKPIAICAICGQDWTPQQADDFPAYLSILITGHIMAPIIIALVSYAALPEWGMVLVILTMAIILLSMILQPAKGVIIATQWWLGMHGFVRPGNSTATDITLP